MLIKLLAFADILTILALLGSSILPKHFVLLMGLYLAIKGLIFITLGSFLTNSLDLLSGLYIILVAFGFANLILTIIVLLFLGQKAIISLF